MVNEPGTPRLLRSINDRAVLELLLSEGTLSRTRLGELTGLSKPTVAQILGRLEAAGLVLATGSSTGKPGPNAQLYAVDPRAAYVAALDVTPARMRAAVADVTGRIVGRSEVLTPGRAAGDTVARVVQAVTSAARSGGLRIRDLDRLVIGTPGAFDPTTQRLRYARHLPGWHDPQLLGELGATLALPIHVDNDVNLAAVAELAAGAAVGSDDFVLLWCEEGLGAAVVIGGQLHRGATGGAGEVGFLPVPGTPLVRKVGVNNAGGYQELAGAKAIVSIARAHGLRASGAEAAVRNAVRTPDSGDSVIAEVGHRLAVGLAAVVAVIDPQLVVLAGSVFTAGGERLRTVVEQELHDLTVPRPRIELSRVVDDPVVLGALHTGLSTTRDLVFNTSDAAGREHRAAD